MRRLETDSSQEDVKKTDRCHRICSTRNLQVDLMKIGRIWQEFPEDRPGSFAMSKAVKLDLLFRRPDLISPLSSSSLRSLFWVMARGVYERADTAVFWDTEGCPIPPDLDVFGAWQKIKESLSKMNYRGESSIYVYGDIEKIKSGIKLEKYDVEELDVEQLDDEPEVISPQIVAEDYRRTEAIYAGEMTAGNPKIVVNHTPEGRGNANHVEILADVLCWPLDNEGPANLILIVGRLTTEHYLFELGVSKLCLLGYNVVVALPENVPDRQTRFETILRWEDLLLGNFSAGEISSPSAGESSRLKRKDPPT